MKETCTTIVFLFKNKKKMSGFNLDKRVQKFIDEWEDFFPNNPEQTAWKKFVNTKKIYQGDEAQIDSAIGQFSIRRDKKGNFSLDENNSTSNYMVLHDATKELNSIYEKGTKILKSVTKELEPTSDCSSVSTSTVCGKCTTIREGLTKVLNCISLIEGTPIYIISRFKLSTKNNEFIDEVKSFVSAKNEQVDYYDQELSAHKLQNESAKNIMLVNSSRRKQEEAKEKVRQRLQKSTEILREITRLCISNEHQNTLQSAQREYEKIFNLFFEYETGVNSLEPHTITIAELNEQLLYKLNFLKSVYPENECVKLVKNKKRKN